MPESHSTPAGPDGKPAKPEKPYPEFPLFPHAAGVWAKKIRGKLHYFGPWDDWKAALDSYEKQKDDLHAGRAPRHDAGAATVKNAVNVFLNHKQALLDAGELSPRSWDDYKATTDILIRQFGRGRLIEDLRPDDFAALRKHLAKSAGPVRLGNVIQRVRSVFKFAFDAELIDRPVRFGPAFKRPSKKVLRIRRAELGPNLLRVEEVRRLIDAAGVPLRAMLLLGINAALGNSDCGNLPLTAVDLDAGWIDYPRPKTGVARRCPLWPETVAALREALARRPAPKNNEHARLFFVTKQGLSWAKDTRDNPVSKETAKLLKALGINGRHRLGFYSLRHVFRTVADETKDQPAVDHVMGHEMPGMSVVYRERISDERLLAVVAKVRAWLFPSASFLEPAEVDTQPGEGV
jgi:integrase